MRTFATGAGLSFWFSFEGGGLGFRWITDIIYCCRKQGSFWLWLQAVLVKSLKEDGSGLIFSAGSGRTADLEVPLSVSSYPLLDCLVLLLILMMESFEENTILVILL